MRSFILAAAAALALPLASLADDFVLVRNAKTASDKVTAEEAKDMFLGKAKSWKKGGPVQVVLPAKGSPELAWLAGLFGVPESTLLSKIKQEVFKGELRKPIDASDEGALLQAVGKTDGALGVASSSASLPAGVASVALAR